MHFIYFLMATCVVAVTFFIGVMWYDKKHQFDW